MTDRIALAKQAGAATYTKRHYPEPVKQSEKGATKPRQNPDKNF